MPYLLDTSAALESGFLFLSLWNRTCEYFEKEVSARQKLHGWRRHKSDCANQIQYWVWLARPDLCVRQPHCFLCVHNASIMCVCACLWKDSRLGLLYYIPPSSAKKCMLCGAAISLADAPRRSRPQPRKVPTIAKNRAMIFPGKRAAIVLSRKHAIFYTGAPNIFSRDPL